jgi:hypothetical protein
MSMTGANGLAVVTEDVAAGADVTVLLVGALGMAAATENGV